MNDLPFAGGTNVPEYTVSEISGAVKRALEGNFGRVRVRGEITELKRYPSGHIYFSLKDESAKIAGVVWKSSVPRLGMRPDNGVEVVATGVHVPWGLAFLPDGRALVTDRGNGQMSLLNVRTGALTRLRSATRAGAGAGLA